MLFIYFKMPHLSFLMHLIFTCTFIMRKYHEFMTPSWKWCTIIIVSINTSSLNMNLRRITGKYVFSNNILLCKKNNLDAFNLNNFILNKEQNFLFVLILIIYCFVILRKFNNNNNLKIIFLTNLFNLKITMAFFFFS